MNRLRCRHVLRDCMEQAKAHHATQTQRILQASLVLSRFTERETIEALKYLLTSGSYPTALLWDHHKLNELGRTANNAKYGPIGRFV